MADEITQQPKSNEYEPSVGAAGEIKDRGMFDFLGKKEEKKPQHQDDQGVIATEFDEKVHVSEPKIEAKEEEKKPGLLEKLHRSNSSSSSSSDEEDGDDEEKKKKRKEKKEKLKEKISGEKEEDTSVPVEKLDEAHVPVAVAHHQETEEKKGFMDKIKEKLPGQHKKPEDDHQVTSAPAPAPAATHEHAAAVDAHEGEAKEKKGILEKIKEKLPGYHSKTDDEKDKDKATAAH